MNRGMRRVFDVDVLNRVLGDPRLSVTGETLMSVKPLKIDDDKFMCDECQQEFVDGYVSCEKGLEWALCNDCMSMVLDDALDEVYGPRGTS